MRPRRLRSTEALRDLIAQTRLHPADFIAPLFVKEGLEAPQAIPSLPGVFQHSVESVVKEVSELTSVGVRAIMIFGVPAQKDPEGCQAWDGHGISQVAISAVRESQGDNVVVFSDLCLDEYTSHGHCGVVLEDGSVDNDSTLELYGRIAVAQARAGAHYVAPSGMMDGQVGAIRGALDREGLASVGILAYSVKYASALYGPFRDAVNVTIEGGGNRKGYQQDFRNWSDAHREADLDVQEGADMVMVKPALTYLDILSSLRAKIGVPLSAYQVSGEYAMIKAAAEAGWIDGKAVALEQLTAIKRAGADFILTYFAKEVSRDLS